jgi:hypothetical protein
VDPRQRAGAHCIALEFPFAQRIAPGYASASHPLEMIHEWTVFRRTDENPWRHYFTPLGAQVARRGSLSWSGRTSYGTRHSSPSGAACVPSGQCCPEDQCPDGSCADAAGQCGGGGEPCGFVTCAPDQFCCRGTITNVCCSAGSDCCSIGRCCPPRSHCREMNGAVGCCLGMWARFVRSGKDS